MVKLPVQLLPGEELIDSWMLLYISPRGEKFEGTCTVTNRRIFYDTKGVFEAAQVSEGVFYYETGKSNCVVIAKNRISQVETFRTALEKKVIITLDDGQQHEFNYGALNIDRIAEALSAQDN
ncbi:MAG: hypothetical protein ABIT05_02680 [Chitinophagaceae bacterium]